MVKALDKEKKQAPVMSRQHRLTIVLIVFAVVVIADQVSKAIIIATIPEDRPYIQAQGPKFFEFTHQRNPGVVGGIFRQNRFMAYLAPITASLVLIYLFRYLDPRSKIQNIAFGLIAGGAGGNLIDRIRLGSVTDFLQFYFYFIPFDFPWKYYPAFNVADSCICTGVFALVVTWFFAGNVGVHPDSETVN